MTVLRGVAMELADCSLPLLKGKLSVILHHTLPVAHTPIATCDVLATVHNASSALSVSSLGLIPTYQVHFIYIFLPTSLICTYCM